MADETTISTPTETVVDTSSSVEPTDVDTSTVEPTNDVEVAETETENAQAVEETPQEQERLYAGKYKSIEELEKGYAETQKFVNKASELEKRLHAMEQERAEAQQKAELERLQQAKNRGFDTVEAQEIADKLQVAELEYYANNLNQVTPEDYETVRQYLANYMQTGHKAYLNEAKKYFNSDIVEKAVLMKNDLQNKLQGEFDAKHRQLLAANEQKLAEELKGSYGEFLDSIKEDEGVSLALQTFCNTGHIQSKEDMQVFVDIVGKIQARAKEQAIKEYEAQKAIEATKEKAVIDAGSNVLESNGDKMPTLAQINAMTQAEYEQAYAKYGDKLLLAN